MEDEENKLFVGSLPVDVTEEDLRTVFGTYGTVTKIIMLDKKAQEQGFKAAFVIYSDSNACEDAIQVLHAVYKIREHADKPIQVKWAKPKAAHGTQDSGGHGGGSGGGGGGGGGGDSNDGFKLFVGSLPIECTQEDLQMVFGTYGEVTKIHMMDTNSVSGNCCALVFYRARESAEDAIAVLDQKYKIREDADKPIVVRWGQSKNEKGGGKEGKGTGKSDKGGKGSGGGATGPYESHANGQDSKGKGKDSKGKDSKGKGKGADSSPWQDRSYHDDSWKAPQSQGKPWQDSSWQSSQSGQSRGGGDTWTGSSHRGGDAGGGSWSHGGDKSSSKGGNKGGKGGVEGGKGGKGFESGKGGKDSGKGGKDFGRGGKDSGKEAAKSSGGGEEQGTRVFVANLPPDIGEDAVSYVFKTYGRVQNIHIMTNKPGPSGSVAGFVEYDSPDEAATAIASLNDKYEIREGYGMLNVKFAKPRSQPY